jgi:hypothetical protein
VLDVIAACSRLLGGTRVRSNLCNCIVDGEGASGWADRLLALRSVQRGHHFVNQYLEERDLQNDLMPQYPCHHIVKQA